MSSAPDFGSYGHGDPLNAFGAPLVMAHAGSLLEAPEHAEFTRPGSKRTSPTPYHSKTRMFGTVPPLLKLLSTRMSPFSSSSGSAGSLTSCAVWSPLNVPLVFRLTSSWKNQ